MVPPLEEATVSLTFLPSCCPHWLPHLLTRLCKSSHSLLPKILQVPGQAHPLCACALGNGVPSPIGRGCFEHLEIGGVHALGAQQSGGVHDWCWNPPKWVHTKCTLTKSGSTGTECKSRDESRRRTLYLLLTGSTGSYV